MRTESKAFLTVAKGNWGHGLNNMKDWKTHLLLLWFRAELPRSVPQWDSPRPARSPHSPPTLHSRNGFGDWRHQGENYRLRQEQFTRNSSKLRKWTVTARILITKGIRKINYMKSKTAPDHFSHHALLPQTDPEMRESPLFQPLASDVRWYQITFWFSHAPFLTAVKNYSKTRIRLWLKKQCRHFSDWPCIYNVIDQRNQRNSCLNGSFKEIKFSYT